MKQSIFTVAGMSSSIVIGLMHSNILTALPVQGNDPIIT